ncbi:sugar acetyltransferase [Anaerobacillus alkalidiazotrophicus]|uniref:Sugar acetyltransferase n=1 Tax=Anaerobacillus alkalidiazotrophicus TaxID=472963 RepID=A0A1S2MCR8_9BACI|nr:acetyltransferase [Anaerobacillus alkalidiazotrophicus]OIJ22376.1 sugar acetyltransferase [Anaerobacillus alkalidiazotrophicus]
MSKPVIIIGGGGHSKVLQDILKLINREIIGITEQSYEKEESNGIKIIGNDELIFKYKASEIELVNAIGSIPFTNKRKLIFTKFKENGYSFATIIHPSSIIASDTEFEEGVQIMAGVIVQPGTKVGYNTILNTKSSIDHDCKIGSHTHIAPGVTLSGNVTIEEDVHVGTSACIIQGVTIGRGTTIGAGSVVLKSISKNSKVVGNPAREVRK